jgi:hypothetical protein
MANFSSVKNPKKNHQHKATILVQRSHNFFSIFNVKYLKIISSAIWY